MRLRAGPLLCTAEPYPPPVSGDQPLENDGGMEMLIKIVLIDHKTDSPLI